MKNINNGNEVTVPIKWLRETGMISFKPKHDFYLHSEGRLILISEIQPPVTRNLDNAGPFRRDAIMAIFKGLISGDKIPPIELNEMNTSGQYRYKVYHGFHRFYASVAVGFKYVPAIIQPVLDLNNL